MTTRVRSLEGELSLNGSHLSDLGYTGQIPPQDPAAPVGALQPPPASVSMLESGKTRV